MGLALATYHATQALLLVGVERPNQSRAVLQESFWPLKLLLLSLLALLSFYIPRWLIDGLFYPIVVLGILFLLLQAVLLIDLAYEWGERLIEEAEGGSKACKYLLVASTLLLNIGAVFTLGLIYIYFDSSVQQTLATANAVLFMVATVCSVLPVVQDANPSASIFQSSLLSLYGIFVLLGAFISDPSRTAGPTAIATAYPVLSPLIAVLSFLYAFLSVTRAALNTGNNLHRILPPTDKDDDQSEEASGTYNYSLFHLSFLMAAFYTVLYITFWQSAATVDGALVVADSTMSFWIRIVSSWLVSIIYLWSLFAPIVLEDRDF